MNISDGMEEESGMDNEDVSIADSLPSRINQPPGAESDV